MNLSQLDKCTVDGEPAGRQNPELINRILERQHSNPTRIKKVTPQWAHILHDDINKVVVRMDLSTCIAKHLTRSSRPKTADAVLAFQTTDEEFPIDLDACTYRRPRIVKEQPCPTPQPTPIIAPAPTSGRMGRFYNFLGKYTGFNRMASMLRNTLGRDKKSTN